MSITNRSDGVFFAGTDSDDVMFNYGSHVSMYGAAGNDEMNAFGTLGSAEYTGNVTMLGGKGNDTLYGWGNLVLIAGGEDNDILYSGDLNNTVLGQSGNDIITNEGAYGLIYGGEDNDYISNVSTASYSTIIGGEGDDTITLDSSAVGTTLIYTKGEGNDVVYGFNSDDKLSIKDGMYSLMDSGNDLFVTVGNGSICFKDLGRSTINVEGVIDRNSGYGFAPVSVIHGDVYNDSTVDNRQYNTTQNGGINFNGGEFNGNVNFNNSGNTNNNSNNNNTSDSNNNNELNSNNNNTSDSNNNNELNSNNNNTSNSNNNNDLNSNNNNTSNSNNTDIYSSTESNTNISSTNISSGGDTNIMENIASGNVNNIGSMTLIKNGDTYIYEGGNKFIENYEQGEIVRLDSDYQGIGLNGANFYINSSSGQLEIQNIRGKYISYSAGNSNVVAYSYVSGSAGTIDGRDKFQAEVLIGADNDDNQIYAGNGGSSLWGGNGGMDTLTGGDGYDEFFYAMGSGHDVITNAGDNDIVNLLGVSLSQITYAEVSYSDINIGFTDGGKLQLQGQSATGFKLEGVTYAADRSTGSWYAK